MKFGEDRTMNAKVISDCVLWRAVASPQSLRVCHGILFVTANCTPCKKYLCRMRQFRHFLTILDVGLNNNYLAIDMSVIHTKYTDRIFAYYLVHVNFRTSKIAI